MTRSTSPTLHAYVLAGVKPIGFWKKFLIAAAAMFSAIFTHWAGFLMQLPESIRDDIASRFAASFSATFVFFIGLAFVLARIFLALFLPLFSLLVALFLRILSFRRIVFAKRLLRYRHGLARWMLPAKLILSLLMFVGLYTPGVDALHLLNVFNIALLGALFSTPVLPIFLKLNTTQTRVGTTKELSRRPALLASILGSLIAATLVCVFMFGSQRYKHLSAGQEVTLASPCVHASGAILLSAGETFLIRVKSADTGSRHLIVGPNFAISSGITSPTLHCAQ
jgi:hypothetical protein